MSVMYVATLDILTEKGGFDPQAARAIGEAIDLEIARSRDSSATREDVAECRHALGEGLPAAGLAHAGSGHVAGQATRRAANSGSNFARRSGHLFA